VHGREEDGERNELAGKRTERGMNWYGRRRERGEAERTFLCGAERLTVRLGGIAEWRGEETSL
jgi:hypothetical protein